MKVLTFLALLGGLVAAAVASAKEYPRNADGYLPWVTVGRSPCLQSEAYSCTPEGTLEAEHNPKFSSQVKDQLLLQVHLGEDQPNSRVVELHCGDHFGVVSYKTGVITNVVASWSCSKTYEADLWSVAVGDQSFELLRIHACHNWATRIGVAVVAPPKPAYIDQGLVSFECPPGTLGCSACPQDEGE